MHSLKGAARIAELHGVETLAHRLETLFAKVREGTLALGQPVVRTIREGLDAIEDLAANRPEGANRPDSPQRYKGSTGCSASRPTGRPLRSRPLTRPAVPGTRPNGARQRRFARSIASLGEPTPERESCARRTWRRS